MSRVIEFLERMGMDATLRHASDDQVALALTEAQMDAAVGAAILARSTAQLYALLGQGPLFCIQTTPGKEKEKEDEQEDDEDKEPAQPKKNSHGAAAHACPATALA